MPSVGTIASTWTSAALSVFVWYCQVVPMTDAPLVKLSISSVYEAQYLPTNGRWRLEQVDRRVELRLGQLVRVGDPERRAWAS